MCRFLLALVVLASTVVDPSLVSAQSYFAYRLPIAPEGEILGAVHQAPVTLVRWSGEHEALVRYEDAELRLETPARLTTGPGEARARIVVGVGEASPVRAGPWQIEMQPGAWAPLRGHDGDASRISLPRGMPRRQGSVRARGTASGRPSRPFAHREVPTSGLSLSCAGQLHLRARAQRGGPSWTVPEGALYGVEGERAPLRVVVHVEGFRVTGYLDARPRECLAALGASGLGTGCGDGVMHGLVVRVPAGTPLYASASSTTPFAHVLRDVAAREHRGVQRSEVCSGGATPSCHLEPPPPTGTQTLFFDRTPDADGDWIFLAEVRVPFETLTRVEGVGVGVGRCDSSVEWPE
jgi:hypothetical protein